MTNSTVAPNSTSCRNLLDPTAITVILPILYCFVFLGGFVLNTMAACIFYKIPNRSSFTIYLKNIVAADMLLVVTLPFKILSESNLGSWQLKAFVCRYSAVIFYSSMYLSIIFLGLISLDRYLKIVQPRKSLSVQKVKFAKVVSVSCWVFIISFALPNIILTNKDPTEKTAAYCLKLKSKVGETWHQIVIINCEVIFWVVFALLTLCYLAILKKLYWSNQKFQNDTGTVIKKANRNIFSILAVFFICFVPYHVIRIPYENIRSAESGCTTHNRLYYAKEATLLLCAFNVCLDPIIYFLLCKSFTRVLRQTLRIKRNKAVKMDDARKREQSSNASYQDPDSSRMAVDTVCTNSSTFPSERNTKKTIQIKVLRQSAAVTTFR
ncbi:P2Y purinoceptor 14-like [Amblyraja radiata]|uniref:P2Y purinoceptor 14-like n=1 Tax=Amblyraja radiata TaxID=386614 RepID=UPI00140266C7|nr:P2Y purinoceptor 14-like [Amblyraja radiata]